MTDEPQFGLTGLAVMGATWLATWPNMASPWSGQPHSGKQDGRKVRTDA